MQRKRWYQLLLWCGVIGLMGLIFALSAQPGGASDELSRVAASPLADMLAAWCGGEAGVSPDVLYLVAATIVRKLAHICEYALLGALLRLLLESYGTNHSPRWAVIAGILYAVTDEIHQTFVPNRTGMVTDVLIDAVGVAAGVLAVARIRKMITVRRK